MVVGLGEVIARRLAGRIGRARIVGRRFGEVTLLAQRAKDLVRAHVVKEHVLAHAARRRAPGLPRHIKQRISAQHIRAHKGFRAEDRAVHVALRRKVHHRVDAVLGEEALDERPIADVALDEDVAGHRARCLGALSIPRLNVRKILQIPRIGERIEIDDAP